MKRCVKLIIYIFSFEQWTEEEENALKAPVIKKYEAEGSPYFSSARLVKTKKENTAKLWKVCDLPKLGSLFYFY